MKQRKVKDRALRPIAKPEEYRDKWKRTEGIDVEGDLVQPKNEHWYKREKRLRRLEAYFRLCIAEGLTRDEIMSRMDMTDVEFDRLERRILESDAARFTAMGTAHRYYVYMLRQEQCAHELDRLIEENRTNDGFSSTAMVAAIKAKSQIVENTMKMGQELGVIAKRSKELRVVGQINLATMNNEELEKLYENMLSKFSHMVEPKSGLPGHFQKMLDAPYEDATSNKNDEDEEDSEGAAEFEGKENREVAS